MKEHKTRIPICLVVGTSEPDTITLGYVGKSTDVIDLCRKLLGNNRLHTNNPTVVRAFQFLHRSGEVELILQRVFGGKVLEFRHDIHGDMIEPWPDEFFEVDFYLTFQEHFNGEE